jgi:Flp pilus assembly protein TadB
MYTDPVGLAMLVTAAALLAVGGFWISRVVRVEV